MECGSRSGVESRCRLSLLCKLHEVEVVFVVVLFSYINHEQ